MMTKESILKKALEMANHNLSCTSANMLMTEPKPGMEADFDEYAAEAELLKVWLEELEDPIKAAKARFERDLTDAQEGDIGVIKDRRTEIMRLEWELTRIEDSV
jgi:hypothetical protein